MQGLQQLLSAARDFGPNRVACLLFPPFCPQAGRPSKLGPGVMEWGQLKPLLLARSWQANLIYTHWATPPWRLSAQFCSRNGISLKKESHGNPPFSKSSCLLTSTRIKDNVPKGFSPAHIQAERGSVNPKVAW